MTYLLHVLVLCSVYSILAVSLDIVAGHTGILSLAHGALFGLGAYTSALLAVRLGAPFFVGVLAGMATASLLSLAISIPSVRLYGDYFIMVTFGFQVIVFSIFNNWMSLTDGPLGIPGIPQPTLLGFGLHFEWQFVVLAGLFAVLAHFIAWRIATSQFGRVLHAIREDELFAQSLGKNPLHFKVVAFAISAALAAAAGSLYAHYITYIDPTSFTVMESILIISMVIIGGAASPWGPLIGAVTLVSLPEALRFVGLPDSLAANLRQILYGSLLVMMMLFRPQGLVGRYRFNR